MECEAKTNVCHGAILLIWDLFSPRKLGGTEGLRCVGAGTIFFLRKNCKQILHAFASSHQLF